MRKSRFTTDSRARPRTWCSAPPRTRSIVAGGVRGYVLRASLVPVDLHGPTPREVSYRGLRARVMRSTRSEAPTEVSQIAT
jgi:hypothetical protein